MGMDRLVYAPKAFALVKAEKGIVDLSPYLVSGSVSRKLDQVSTAELEFRNPGKRFTEGADGPVFNPMDPVVILMKRLHNRPVQVFTGYIDSAPYVTLKPGTVRVSASCTLKKLLYTYYDPGLPFFHKFIHRQGWTTVEGLGTLPDNAGRTVDQQEERERQNQDLIDGEFPEPLAGGLNDASFGNMLYDTLLYIGNWHPDTIYIENLPDGIIDLVEGIFYQIEQASKDQRKEFRQLLKQMLENTGQLGNGNPQTSAVTGTTSPEEGDIVGLNDPAHEEFCQIVAARTGLSLRVLAAWCDVEGGPAYNPLNIGPGHVYASAKAGANATVDLLNQSLYSMIMRAANRSDEEQIRAIASSPWLTGSATFNSEYYDTILTIWQEIRIRPRGNSQ
jgi:hypothetical protein